MRITTSMLNESARKAGLPINSVSLLNYINKGNSQNTLLNAISNKKNKETDAIKKNDYEKLEKEAAKLEQTTKCFLQEGEENIFTQAKSRGSNEEIYNSIEEMLDNYNSTLKTLQASSNTMNHFYRQMLVEVAKDNREVMKEFGITFGKDGTASVDTKLLQTADTESLEKAFGSDSDFTQKIAFLAGKVSDNAQANMVSLGSQYNASGKNYYPYANKYDMWG